MQELTELLPPMGWYVHFKKKMKRASYISYPNTFFIMFLSTGIFAIAGALYTWGDGWLFAQDELDLFLLPFADLLLTGPLCFCVAWGLRRRKDWAMFLGLLACGILLFGSLLVYIKVFWWGRPYPLKLILPPVFGIGLAFFFTREVFYWEKDQKWNIKKNEYL